MSTVAVQRHPLRRVLGSPGDVLLSLGLLAFALAELAGLSDLPRHVAVPGAVLMTVPLLWRRRLPLAVACLVTGAFSAQTLLGVPHNAQLASLAAMLVVCYSVGAHSDTRGAVWGLSVILAMAMATVPANPDWAVSDFGFAGLVVMGSWGAGRLVRSRAAEARTHQNRAAELAAAGEERAQRAIEAERRRIARELHDIVAHSVSLMVLQAGAAEEMVKSDPSRAVEPLQTVQVTGRRALTDMKLLLGILRDSESDDGLRPQPGIHDISSLVDQVRSTGLTVHMAVDGVVRPVGAGVALSVYRVIQEALTNVMKHAPDAEVSLCLRYAHDRLEVELTNTPPSTAGEMGLESGLRGMRDRVDLFGGELHAGPTDQGGFRVHARLPLDTPGGENDPGPDL